MKNNLILLLFLFFSFCETNKSTFLIIDENLKYSLDEKIKYLESLSNKEKIEKEIVIEYLISEVKKDTVLRIINTKPYTCEKIKGYCEYKGYKIFLYTTLNNEKISKVFKIISKFNNCKDFVKPKKFDSERKYFLEIKNGRTR